MFIVFIMIKAIAIKWQKYTSAVNDVDRKKDLLPNLGNRELGSHTSGCTWVWLGCSR